jgi:UDP-glucose 4-epimerase
VSGGNFVKGDLADAAALRQVFSVTRFDAVMHFASSIEVGESVTNPGKYYANNVSSTVKLLDSMVEAGVKRFACSLHQPPCMARPGARRSMNRTRRSR